MDLNNKTILVTGADGGIGSALCRALVREGANLVLNSTNAQRLDKLATELASSGYAGAVSTVAADVGSAEGRAGIVAECERLGGIDVLVNLAGVLDFQWFEQQDPERIETTLRINLLAPMLLTQSLLPQLASKKEATILNVGSIFASIGHPGFVTYCASKAGVKSFTEALGRELADTTIRVSYIAPRATATTLNTDRINSMNRELGNSVDSPDYVAARIVSQLQNDGLLSYLGWPEKLFVRLNALLPSVVRKALLKNLGLIKQFASS